jgi:hypothetical protein
MIRSSSTWSLLALRVVLIVLGIKTANDEVILVPKRG